jgi:hypothetical protein
MSTPTPPADPEAPEAPEADAAAEAAPATTEGAAAQATDDKKDCEPPRRHPCCWIGEPDWHKAETRIELPPERYLEAYWHAEILDYEAKNPLTRIIERREEFVVRIRIELCGRLWRCICGNWCFNVGFTPFGDGERFNLSQHVNSGQFEYNDWKGCDTLCIERCIRVPACAIPADRCGTVYDVAAWFELRCCGDCKDKDSTLAVSGFEKLGVYQFV